MPHHDVECSKCGLIIRNYYASPWPQLLRHEDGGELVILWQADTARTAAAHPRERTVVWRDPKTGHVSFPGRNDEPMPQRYREAGYQRVEFEHAHEVEQLEKEQNVRCEGLWYNSGNGV